MNKLAIIPIFFLTMCGTAPITDPPAHACSPRLDGEPTFCPPLDEDFPLKPKPLIPKEQVKGEIEKNATQPVDAINNALMEFNNGSNDPTKSEELLQLPSYRDQPSG